VGDLLRCRHGRGHQRGLVEWSDGQLVLGGLVLRDQQAARSPFRGARFLGLLGPRRRRRQRGCSRSWQWESSGAVMAVATSVGWWSGVTASWCWEGWSSVTSRRRGLPSAAHSSACHAAGRRQRHGCQANRHDHELGVESHGGWLVNGIYSRAGG
jgi:hypothetical protein